MPKTLPPIRKAIDALGGVKAASRTLKAPPTTIYSWIQKGDAPAWRWPQIEAALRVVDRFDALPQP
jgi:hypothetical protein